MSEKKKSWLAVLNVHGALIVAVFALFVSIYSIHNENKKSDDIALREWTRAQAEVKPILSIIERRYIKGYGVRLRNVGLGPAVIDSAVFEKTGYGQTSFLKKLFQPVSGLGGINDNEFDDYVSIPANSILKSGESWDLIKVSGEDKFKEYLRLEEGISFAIKFKDIYGNEMDTYSGKLSGK